MKLLEFLVGCLAAALVLLGVLAVAASVVALLIAAWGFLAGLLGLRRRPGPESEPVAELKRQSEARGPRSPAGLRGAPSSDPASEMDHG